MASMISACLLIASIILQSTETFAQQKCGDEPLCYHKPDNYPQTTIDEYLTQNSYLLNTPDDDDEEIQKLKYEVDDDDLNCSTEVSMKRPFTLQNEDRSYPVVQSKYLTQKIRQVSCRSRGRPCFNGVSLSGPYNATCETQQGSIQLYVFDEDKNEVVAMTAPYNCCCKCTIKNTFN